MRNRSKRKPHRQQGMQHAIQEWEYREARSEVGKTDSPRSQHRVLSKLLGSENPARILV